FRIFGSIVYQLVAERLLPTARAQPRRHNESFRRRLGIGRYFKYLERILARHPAHFPQACAGESPQNRRKGHESNTVLDYSTRKYKLPLNCALRLSRKFTVCETLVVGGPTILLGLCAGRCGSGDPGNALPGLYPEILERLQISTTADCCLRPDHDRLPVLAGRCGALCTWLNYANHRDADRL